MAGRREARHSSRHLRGAGGATRLQGAKGADKVLYEWDALIRLFTDSILKGEAEGTTGQEPDPSEMEKALRTMALEPRLRRRLLGGSVTEAKVKAEASKAERFARNIAPGVHGADEKVGYVFLILAHHGEAPGPAYDEYRKRRRVMLRGYCLSMLHATAT
jgi:hypothetical protein